MYIIFLKPFSLFSTEGLRCREQLHVQERHCPADKIASLHSITAKNKIQVTTLRNSCYYDNYKTRGGILLNFCCN